ncbi:MAG: DUF4416 family protein [Spirochaetia bacterium]
MGLAKAYIQEKLFMGCLFHDKTYVSRVATLLESQFGPIDCTSSMQKFSDFSPYYNQEMGGDVFRIFFSFERLVDPSELASIKVWTNTQEAQFLSNNQRRINLDPGLISSGRIALATTKNAGHRMALSAGIYIEMTLFYAKKAYHSLPWTYPDFQHESVKNMLLNMRKTYMDQLKN